MTPEPGTPEWYEEIKADPDRACEHEHFEADVAVQRLTKDEQAGVAVGPINAFIAEVRVTCAQCGEKFRFLGLDYGAGGATPTCTIDELTAHLPVRPASSDADFGLGVPALAIRVRREERGCDENDPRHELATRMATNIAMSGVAFGQHAVDLGSYDCDADPLGLREPAMHAVIALACNGLLDYDAVLADDQ